MKSKWRWMAAALALAFLLMTPAHAATERLAVNGQNLWNRAGAYLVNGTTYVSLRTMAEVLAPKAKVTWSGGVASIKGNGVEVAAAPGQRYLTVNDRAIYIPDGVRMVNGRVMVPVRAIAKALGGTVDWSHAAGVTVTPGGGRPGETPYTADDLYWMARIISAESRGEPLKGKIAVGTVVLNRVASGEFPNGVKSVIFDDKWGIQFTPVANGTIYNDPTAESVLAAKLVLDGGREAGDSLYFIAPSLTTNRWVMENRPYVTTIGVHWFYR